MKAAEREAANISGIAYSAQQLGIAKQRSARRTATKVAHLVPSQPGSRWQGPATPGYAALTNSRAKWSAAAPSWLLMGRPPRPRESAATPSAPALPNTQADEATEALGCGRREVRRHFAENALMHLPLSGPGIFWPYRSH